MWNWRDRGRKQMNIDSGEPDSSEVEVRALLRGLEGQRAEPSPFFARRVMAAIEAREAELVRRARAWAAVPTFASRLSAIAVLLLVVASTLLWTGTHRQPVATTGLVEDLAANGQAANQDDVFVSPGEDVQ